ncbi:unnamed protein product [Brassicogethes aeneus]|uniref:Malectin domain-containing protein n=1 Tax=Brassicogethes aeneus TaxID=1431903 RepID=A0A9P0B5J4_BRAAE|nr:unnamed protein product [Brassicogethes aeneus]
MIIRNCISTLLLVHCLLLLCFTAEVFSLGQLIYAVNCGGEAHTDAYGIRYERDPLHGKIGIASDYGKRLLIGRVPPNDYILYQTERYHTSTFGYDIPVNSDGDYVLVLKFCEVYFNAPDQKVFDVVLNGEHTIVTDLDIFEKVGRGVAHDEHVPFSISKGRLNVNGEESEIRGNRIRVEFIKGYKDNPKINAMYVIKGDLDDMPKLPPIPLEQQPLDQQQQQQAPPPKEEPEAPKVRPRASGPKQPDPYESDESSIMLPLFIAIGAFIPILFCLCKL